MQVLKGCLDMKGNHYFLIGREKETNRLNVVSLSKGKNLIEEIDLYTTCFQDAKSLSSFLYKQGKIRSINTDFFIVYQTNHEKEKNLYTNEVLYGKNEWIRSLASKSLHKVSFEKEADQLLNKFCFKMEHDKYFYENIIYHETNLYPKFIQYFSENRSKNSFSLKYQDGGWMRKSYLLLRNIMETFIRYENSQKEYLKNKKERLLCQEKLLLLTSKSYNELQPSFFDFLEWSKEENKEENDGHQKRR